MNNILYTLLYILIYTYIYLSNTILSPFLPWSKKKHCHLSQLSQLKKKTSYLLVVHSLIRTFEANMEKIRVDVVGLFHCIRNHWKEYAAKAVGKQLVLQPQPENVADPYAIRVREGQKNVGYVAVPDIDVIYQALKGSGIQRLRGVVVESNPEPPVLTVEIEVEQIDWDYEPFNDSVYHNWHYDGLSLIPPKLEQLGDLTVDLMDELESTALNQGSGSDTEGANRDTILMLFKQLLESNLYDPSREMTRSRYRIERLLAQSNDIKMQKAAHQLRQQKGMLMRHGSRDQVARYLFVKWPGQLHHKGFEDSHYTYDNRLDELEQQLRAFPYQLYDKFLSDPVDFLREVYYKHVPRKYWYHLLSGIVLMILKGRVKIQRWGRDGATEPIKQMETLAPSMSPSERETAMKESLKELLEKKDANGKLIISQKNQWAAIISILSFDYHVDCDDLRDMCHKMDEWGFGKDSPYENYCDYDNVSKCSDYANDAFSQWEGAGTAHKRQVLAATELRAILRPKIGYH